MTNETQTLIPVESIEQVGIYGLGLLVVGFTVRYITGLAQKDRSDRQRLEAEVSQLREELETVTKVSNENKVHWKACEARRGELLGRVRRLEKFLTKMDPSKFDVFAEPEQPEDEGEETEEDSD
jgi:hypothetical protein